MTWIDLHLHSTASDGAYAPAKLMELAHARHLSAVALTDHDTVDGHAEARPAAEALGMTFVPGVEIEASQGRKTVHLLGYLFDASSPNVSLLLETVRGLREARNRRIAERLQGMQFAIDYDVMRGRFGDRAIGRPHFAAELMGQGIVSSLRQAFARYLGTGGSAYVPRENLPAEAVIAAIHDSGGVVSLAHPSRVEYESLLELKNLLYRLRDAGLDAIEVRHPDITPTQSREYERLAAQLGLARTGGSDFHALGAVKRGVGFSGERISCAWLDELHARRPFLKTGSLLPRR